MNSDEPLRDRYNQLEASWNSVVISSRQYQASNFTNIVITEFQRINKQIAERPPWQLADIAEAIHNDSIFRSYVVDVKITATKFRQELVVAQHSFSNWLATNGYARGRNREERRDSLEVILEAGLKVISEFDTLIEICDEIKEDIKERSWVFKSRADIIKDGSKPELGIR